MGDKGDFLILVDLGVLGDKEGTKTLLFHRFLLKSWLGGPILT